MQKHIFPSLVRASVMAIALSLAGTVAAQEKTPASVEFRPLPTDASLKAVMWRWARIAGAKIEWRASVDYPVTRRALAMPGQPDFFEALHTLSFLYQKVSVPLAMYTENGIIVVANAADAKRMQAAAQAATAPATPTSAPAPAPATAVEAKADIDVREKGASMPQAAPAAPVIPKKTWTLVAGNSIRKTVAEWSETAGTQLVWSSRDDYIAQGGAVLEGELIEAVKSLLGAMRPHSNLIAEAGPNNTIVVK